MHEDMGLVSQVFGQQELAKLKGTRRSGTRVIRRPAQHDQKRATLRGRLHSRSDGDRTQRQLINADLLRDELERKGSIFQTTADSEIILHLLAQPIDNGSSALAPCGESKAHFRFSS